MRLYIMLTVFLLVSFKSFSQKDTVKKVILTESVSKEVIKELIKYDYAIQTIIEQEKRINNLKKEINSFKELNKIKESIDSIQTKLIINQDKILKLSKPLELHGYVGVQTIKLEKKIPSFYGSVLIEFSNWGIGANTSFQINTPITWGIAVEYKVF